LRQASGCASLQRRAVMPVIYHVAGPADDEDYATAEYLAEMLMNSLQGVECVLHPILPDDWSSYVASKAAFLGCKPRAPLVWLSSGIVIGGLPDFTAECDKKYGINCKHVPFETWPRIAAENMAAALAAQRGDKPAPVGSSSAGAERGEAVSDALLEGNRRYVAGSSGTGDPSTFAADVKVATVLALTPLPAEAHVLLDCPASSLFVVPCLPIGVDLLAAGNAEHGVMALKTNALIVLAAPTAELGFYVQAARDALDALDAPLWQREKIILKQMMPALSRTLSVAPPRCTVEEVDHLCLEEWTRDSAEELLRHSEVLNQMKKLNEVHIETWVCTADGAFTPV